VVTKYDYLGTDTPVDELSWHDHVNDTITKAKRRFADVLWVCKVDMAIRLRGKRRGARGKRGKRGTRQEARGKRGTRREARSKKQDSRLKRREA
jgi:hypothetical protein